MYMATGPPPPPPQPHYHYHAPPPQVRAFRPSFLRPHAHHTNPLSAIHNHTTTPGHALLRTGRAAALPLLPRRGAPPPPPRTRAAPRLAHAQPPRAVRRRATPPGLPSGGQRVQFALPPPHARRVARGQLQPGPLAPPPPAVLLPQWIAAARARLPPAAAPPAAAAAARVAGPAGVDGDGVGERGVIIFFLMPPLGLCSDSRFRR
jgi:hypothetical protein